MWALSLLVVLKVNIDVDAVVLKYAKLVPFSLHGELLDGVLLALVNPL